MLRLLDMPLSQVGRVVSASGPKPLNSSTRTGARRKGGSPPSGSVKALRIFHSSGLSPAKKYSRCRGEVLDVFRRRFPGRPPDAAQLLENVVDRAGTSVFGHFFPELEVLAWAGSIRSNSNRCARSGSSATSGMPLPSHPALAGARRRLAAPFRRCLRRPARAPSARTISRPTLAVTTGQRGTSSSRAGGEGWLVR